jgi:hypothetical protein
MSRHNAVRRNVGRGSPPDPAPAGTEELEAPLQDTHPAADLYWDAASRHVDRHGWRLRAGTILRILRSALPTTPEQTAAWIRHHGLITPSPAQIFRALDEALSRASPGQR